jgi:hypothetical protein
MNSYTAERREKLAQIIGDEAVPMSERLDAAHDFLEQEVRAAFHRGTRTPVRERRVFSPRLSRDGKSALQAGVLTRVEEA